MHYIGYADSLQRSLNNVLRALENAPEVEVKGQKTKEIHPFGLTITDPLRRTLIYPKRGNNPFASLAEVLWVMGGWNNISWLEPYLPRASDFSDDGKTWRCLAKETKIPLLSGKTRTIKKIVERFNKGIINDYVYSWSQKDGWTYGKIVNAVKSKKVKQMVLITLDNDEKLKCTLDHKIMLRDGSYEEAQNLQIGESLMPFYRKYDTSSAYVNKNGNYEKLKDNHLLTWKFTHMIIFERKGDRYKECIHHVDCNPNNNTPDNLISLTHSEHRKLHGMQNIEKMKKLRKTDIEYKERMDKISIKNLEEYNKKHRERFKHDKEYANKYRKHRSSNCKNMNSDKKIKRLQILGRIKKVCENIEGEITAEKYELTRKGCVGAPNVKTIENKYGRFEDIISEIFQYNHKVKNVEVITVDDEWVYDIEVDNACHNFALECGIVVHNSGYGPRLRKFSGVDDKGKVVYVDQINYVYETLKKDPASRQAVIAIWDPAKENTIGNSRDYPCNSLLHFMIREGKLYLNVYVRSNDAIWGFAAINIYEWTVLQEILAGLLDVGIGELDYFVGSMHIYERHFEKLTQLIESYVEYRPYYPEFRFFTGEDSALSYEDVFCDIKRFLQHSTDVSVFLKDSSTYSLHCLNDCGKLLKAYLHWQAGNINSCSESLSSASDTMLKLACYWWLLKQTNAQTSVERAFEQLEKTGGKL